MRSISTKLILAFATISIISLAIIFSAARWNTRQEFINFLSDESQTEVITELVDYHRSNGTWTGVDIVIVPNTGQQRGPGDPFRRMPFVVVDQEGKIIVPGDRYKLGQKLSEEDLEAGVPIYDGDLVIGFLIPIRIPFQGNPREVEFIQRTNLTLIYALLIGAIITLLLGFFLSRTISRPIKELTSATYAITKGDLAQRVPVRSKDEIGELASSFNKMSEELQRSVNTRKQMTADIAHELRTPISLILGHADAIHDDVLPPTIENIEIIREEAIRLERLVDDLRILSLADAGELQINPETIDLGKFIKDTVTLYKQHAASKGITLNTDIDPHLPALELDPARMSQVFSNLLDNALRYTPKEGSIMLSGKNIGKNIELRVIDTGPGMESTETGKIFDRFYRTDTSRQRDEGGSGLGLAIAKSIVQEHGGQIKAESEAGKGLTVIISIPHSKNNL